MITTLHDFTTSLPPLLQWVGVIVAGAIPFIESYFGSTIGVIAGITPPVAILAAIVGNVASMLALVLGASALRSRTARPQKQLSPRRQKLKNAFDKYGVAGVSLLGQSLLPSQITSMALVSFGAPKNAVILWQVISIILWGTAFGVLAALGVNVLAT